ncbi:MAG: hypothetical protein U0936_22550 [Planctomycetaceae bacterium]
MLEGLKVEGVVVAFLGSMLGADLAVSFAKVMILGLTTWWVGAIGTQFLRKRRSAAARAGHCRRHFSVSLRQQ